ncbi:MAG: ATP-dependent DNA helicase [Planctomycetota bacterium]|nr:MAG: ATP-dependent DNA helicase [Planctomycetota bacterium]
MPLRGLTREQEEAVLYDGHLLLTACPGSGKTKTLVSKIAYKLIDDQLSLGRKRIVAITYTNTAAETIMDRLDKLGIKTNNLWIGTIHSFCLEWIIRPYCGEHTLTRHRFRVLDEFESRSLISELKNKHGIGYFNPFPTALNQQYEIDATHGSNLYSALEEYHNTLIEKNCIDFDLILSISNQLLTATPEIALRLSRLFPYLYVDEYQDTNQRQYKILEKIIRHQNSILTFIGDVDQAIYTNLGAIAKNADQLKNDFQLDHIEVKNLSGCFRSTQRIIDFYKSFQDENINIVSKMIAPQEPSNINYKKNINRGELHQYIIDIVNQYKDLIDFNEMVIVAPTWRDVINLAKSMRQIAPEIPLDAPSVSPIPKSIDNYWYDLIKMYFTPISPDNYSRRKRMAQKILDNLAELGFVFEIGTVNLRSIVKAINSLNLNFDVEIHVFVSNLIDSFCFLINLDITSVSTASDAKQAFIDSIINRVREYEIINNASSLREYYRDRNGVSISTYHQTKGKEYELVIAYGLLKGKIPHWNDIIEGGNPVADYVARRLLYVICSRAKRHLYLISELGHSTRRGEPLIPTEQLTRFI